MPLAEKYYAIALPLLRSSSILWKVHYGSLSSAVGARTGARSRRRRLLPAAASSSTRRRLQLDIVLPATPRTPRRVAEAYGLARLDPPRRQVRVVSGARGSGRQLQRIRLESHPSVAVRPAPRPPGSDLLGCTVPAGSTPDRFWRDRVADLPSPPPPLSASDSEESLSSVGITNTRGGTSRIRSTSTTFSSEIGRRPRAAEHKLLDLRPLAQAAVAEQKNRCAVWAAL